MKSELKLLKKLQIDYEKQIEVMEQEKLEEEQEALELNDKVQEKE